MNEEKIVGKETETPETAPTETPAVPREGLEALAEKFYASGPLDETQLIGGAPTEPVQQPTCDEDAKRTEQLIEKLDEEFGEHCGHSHSNLAEKRVTDGHGNAIGPARGMGQIRKLINAEFARRSAENATLKKKHEDHLQEVRDRLLHLARGFAKGGEDKYVEMIESTIRDVLPTVQGTPLAKLLADERDELKAENAALKQQLGEDTDWNQLLSPPQHCLTAEAEAATLREKLAEKADEHMFTIAELRASLNEKELELELARASAKEIQKLCSERGFEAAFLEDAVHLLRDAYDANKKTEKEKTSSTSQFTFCIAICSGKAFPGHEDEHWLCGKRIPCSEHPNPRAEGKTGPKDDRDLIVDHLRQVRDDLLAANKNLSERVKKLEDGIREHRDQKGDARCWLDDQQLYSLLGGTKANTALPSKEAFLSNCARYWECRQNPNDKYEGEQEQIKNLQKLLKEAQEDEQDVSRVAATLSKLLTRTADALKGEPVFPLGMHSWHDLPEKVLELQEQLKEKQTKEKQDGAEANRPKDAKSP